jgi:hypothetical protein
VTPLSLRGCGSYPSAKQFAARLFCACSHLQQVKRSLIPHFRPPLQDLHCTPPTRLSCAPGIPVRVVPRPSHSVYTNVIWPCKNQSTSQLAARFCTATTMAEATEVNPIVFFDVTLGGMPARTYSYMARQPLTPHRTLFSFAHVLLRDLPTTMTDISKQERSWEESRWSCSRMWFPRLLRTFVNFALARPRTIEVSRRATRAANSIVW